MHKSKVQDKIAQEWCPHFGHSGDGPLRAIAAVAGVERISITPGRSGESSAACALLMSNQLRTVSQHGAAKLMRRDSNELLLLRAETHSAS